jgi:HSP20 family protein
LDDFFTLQRDVDRLFNQFWSDLPTRTAVGAPGSVQVNTTEDGWRIDIPLPGIDPQNVTLEVAGATLSLRVEEPDPNNKDAKVTRYEQTLTIPQFLDTEQLSASHRHGMLRLMLPLKESVKPRRIQIDNAAGDTKQLTAA